MHGLQGVINSLRELRHHLCRHKFENIYLLCGNNAAGKKTFIHFLMGKEVEADTSEEGEDILKIS